MEQLTLAVLGVVLVATLMQSTFGFGNALFAMPLLILLVGIDTARPLVALVSATVAAGVVFKDWRDMKIGRAWPLLLAAAVGIPIGLVGLSRAPEPLVTSLLALVIIGFALFRLVKLRPITLKSNRWGWLFALFAGILGGAYNTYGPPLAVFGTLRGWTPEQFRVNMQVLFAPMALFILLGHYLAELWTSTVFNYYLLSLPLIALAVLLGRQINRTFPTERFHTVLYLVLIGLGLLLLGQALSETNVLKGSL